MAFSRRAIAIPLNLYVSWRAADAGRYADKLWEK